MDGMVLHMTLYNDFSNCWLYLHLVKVFCWCSWSIILDTHVILHFTTYAATANGSNDGFNSGDIMNDDRAELFI